MPIVNEALQKHTLLLREGDYAALQERYRTHGAAAVIRRLVSAHVDKFLRPVTKAELAQLEEIDDPTPVTHKSKGHGRKAKGQGR